MKFQLYCNIQECLGIQNMSRKESGLCSGVNFLLHHKVLYEISAFGLQDSAEKVGKYFCLLNVICDIDLI